MKFNEKTNLFDTILNSKKNWKRSIARCSCINKKLSRVFHSIWNVSTLYADISTVQFKNFKFTKITRLSRISASFFYYMRMPSRWESKWDEFGCNNVVCFWLTLRHWIWFCEVQLNGVVSADMLQCCLCHSIEKE